MEGPQDGKDVISPSQTWATMGGYISGMLLPSSPCLVAAMPPPRVPCFPAVPDLLLLTRRRPIVRPSHQRLPQPSFTFPITPPEPTVVAGQKMDQPPATEMPRENLATPWSLAPGASPMSNNLQYFPEARSLVRPFRHRRAMSDSTVNEATAKESDSGAFKVVISKPSEDQRPRTMEDLDPATAPLLKINIPSWRIGTPRFTLRGTPVIRASSYAPSEDPRASIASGWHRPEAPRPALLSEDGSRKPSSPVIPQICFSQPSSQSRSPDLPSPRVRPSRLTYLSTHFVIEPAMFDYLTFKPACDDRSIVRYSPASGAVTAATPPRIVAEITSPTFLDYELISDFFLTYRSFLEPEHLLRMLVARLRWAIARHDEVGMVVRVRTFVALRHWILNYFLDDFVTDYSLRVTFCHLINTFVEELSQDESSCKVQLRILGELKKCWRRVCSLHWDGPEFDESLDASAVLAPGGIAGKRDPSLDPSFSEHETSTRPQSGKQGSARKSGAETTSLFADANKSASIPDSIVYEERPLTPDHAGSLPTAGNANEDPSDGPASPMSLGSMDIVSCSFPGMGFKTVQPYPSHSLAAHPIPMPTDNNTEPVATTPKAVVGRRIRLDPLHKRNNSRTDSLREHESEKGPDKDQKLSDLPPYTGSLVRGNLFPPGQPFVDVAASGDVVGVKRQTTICQPERETRLNKQTHPGAMSGHGMRKLLGSVRRALSTLGPSSYPSHGQLLNFQPPVPRGATVNRLPGTGVVPPPACARPNMPVRIDLLGAGVAEDFKRAVREEEEEAAAAAATAAEQPLDFPMPPRHQDSSATPNADGMAAQRGNDGDDYLPRCQVGSRGNVAELSLASQSIVIIDDTVTDSAPAPHCSIHTVSPSVDTFAETFMTGGADPTPPNTPPGESEPGVPRRSSYLLNQHVFHQPEEEALPAAGNSLSVLARSQSQSTRATRPSGERSRPPVSSLNRRSRHRNCANNSSRIHRRRSSHAQPSLNSVVHRRNASSVSGPALPSTRQSLSATTYSEESAPKHISDTAKHEPLRALRRRPGGNLRDVNRVDDLNSKALRKSRSLGSLDTYSDSFRSSLSGPYRNSFDNADVATTIFSQRKTEVFSLGRLAEKSAKPKRELSLFGTYSSKPVMRPSFEAEAQKLAQIPDADDDGGIESALLKLEGRYGHRPAKLSMDLRDGNETNPNEEPDGTMGGRNTFRESFLDPETIGVAIGTPSYERASRLCGSDWPVADAELPSEPAPHGESGKQESHEGLYCFRGGRETGLQSFLSDGSHESFNSIPLLDRGLTDEGQSQTASRVWTGQSIFQGPDDDATPLEANPARRVERANHLSFEFIEKTDSLEQILPGQTVPTETEGQSFLNDESDNDSELSSELSTEDANFPESRGRDKDFSSASALPMGETARTSDERGGASVGAQTARDPKKQSLEPKIPELYADQIWGQNLLPPTPEASPSAAFPNPAGPPDDLAGTAEILRNIPRPDVSESRKYSAHLPFILAFDSDVLAQQFTLIEKDALNEIDWKELVDMQWRHCQKSNCRSWVQFLRHCDAQGVEVVIARFNIMVKWAVSEIVLTKNIEERARCIIKYIHIAANCRRYRNFATLVQLTIALTSNEIGRLTRTWSLVPARDLKTLQELEALVTPTRNFYNLRAEMETGSDSPCIPFVMIYTHDLLYNAQRPSEVASSPTTAPLVNFERCRIAASVVRTVLRLLEASAKYKFQPVEGTTERCLWMGALSDEEIRHHSQGLE